MADLITTLEILDSEILEVEQEFERTQPINQDEASENQVMREKIDE
jgi:hypothetical protein